MPFCFPQKLFHLGSGSCFPQFSFFTGIASLGVFISPDGKKHYSKTDAQRHGYVEEPVQQECAKAGSLVPHCENMSAAEEPKAHAALAPIANKEDQKDIDSMPSTGASAQPTSSEPASSKVCRAKGANKFSFPADDGEIATAVPVSSSQDKESKDKSESPSVKNQIPKKETAASQEHVGCKRNLLEQCRDREASSKKPRSKETEVSSPPSGAIVSTETLETPEKKPPADNKRRDTCDICNRPRGDGQRGAACPKCLLAWRALAGHQSLQKCRADSALLASVREASLEESRVEKDSDNVEDGTVRQRLHRIECKMDKIMRHLGLK